MERPETPFSRPREALDRLSQSSGELRQGFGADSVVQRPTVRVREVETMLLLSLLKSMKELLLLSRGLSRPSTMAERRVSGGRCR